MGAYKLRFEVLTLEGGDTNHADFEKKILKDSIDDSGLCKLLVAIDASTSTVVSTQRITFRKETPFIADHIYPFSKLAVSLNKTEEEVKEICVLHDRSATQMNYRGLKPGLWTRLFNLCEEFVFKEMGNQSIILGYVRTDNVSTAKMLTHKFKWQLFNNRIKYKGKDFDLYYNITENIII